MRCTIRLSVLLWTFSVVTALSAAPSRRNSAAVLQPDRSLLHIMMTGDEHSHTIQTTDGIALEAADDGTYRYIITDSKGNRTMSTAIAHDADMRSAAEHIIVQSIRNATRQTDSGLSVLTRRNTHENIEAAPGDYSNTGYPAFGEKKGLVLLADFPDRPFSMDSASIVRQIYRQLNSDDYHDTITYQGQKYHADGSAREYFEAQSYGQFSPSFEIVGPITADNSYSYYGKNSGASGDIHTTAMLVAEICDKAYSRGMFTPQDFDSDNDGSADFIYLIYAGRGENYSGSDPNTIWPHQFEISRKYDGIEFNKYVCSCELFFDSDDVIDGIGTICHELCHVLGLPDFYNVNQNDAFVIKNWSIMDYGMYDNLGFSPVGMTAFERFSIGWMDLVTADGPGSYQLQNLGKMGIAYRLPTDDPDNFIVLESHDRTGWFKYQAAAGLMATAVSYNRQSWLENRVNVRTGNPKYSIIPADNILSTETLTGDLFPYEGLDSLTMWSTPSACVVHSYYARYPIHDIRYSEGTASFSIPSATALSRTETDRSSLSVTGNVLHISAGSGVRTTVRLLSGQVVAEKVGSCSIPLPTGIYLVSCGDFTRKVSVR